MMDKIKSYLQYSWATQNAIVGNGNEWFCQIIVILPKL